jgi:hypothetical protein
MTNTKYPSIAELKAQGYPDPRKIELARQAEARARKNQRANSKRQREAAMLDMLVEHVSMPMRRNDHAGVIKALQDVQKYMFKG